MKARWCESLSNEVRGVLVIGLGAGAALASLGCSAATVVDVNDDLPRLPEAVSAFGSTLFGGAIYVLGGHLGAPHGFSTASESGAFRRLDLAAGSAWQGLGAISPALEGAGLVAHGGLLYRVGGLRVDNAPGEPAELRSVTTVESYDPATARWTDVEAMPEGRSAHGTVVVGDRLYAVAGWDIEGDPLSGRFRTGGFVLDLSRAGAAWEPIPSPPFKLRSLTVAAVGDDIYAIGGATEVPGEFSADVYVLDTAAGTWKRGPSLPAGSSIAGFGAASCSIGGSLYVNDADGLFRLARASDTWEPVGPMKTPRIFNALLCASEDEVIAVGGFEVESGLSPTADVEAISVSPTGP